MVRKPPPLKNNPDPAQTLFRDDAVQRLVIAIMLFFITALIGTLCLLVNGNIVLPI
jgi:hypothetical protein